MTSNIGNEYIDTTDYNKLLVKIKDVVDTMEDHGRKNEISRKARYIEVDIEKERAASRLAPDEQYIPQHIIDTNIRREQASYVQYETQSNRACIFESILDPSMDTTALEKDFTNRVRYNDWQTPKFANIDSFQQNGWACMELVFDESKPGHVAYEAVPMGDFGMAIDTKDVQENEMVCRNYYFSKTDLLSKCQPDSVWQFSEKQVKKITETAPKANTTDQTSSFNGDKSLYCIQKVMFRVQGIVYVAWCCSATCDDWIREPRKLFIGTKAPAPQPAGKVKGLVSMVMMAVQGPQFIDVDETEYPYFIYPYLISENSTIDRAKGRVYLDQDTQTAATSLISSLCTGFRRASGLYFGRDEADPNDQLGMQKNVYLKQGAVINAKIRQFQLAYPDASMLSAVQAIVSMNQAETSKVNFAVSNRKDSRKTATEINAATQEGASLSTVQVVLYSTATKKLSEKTFSIVASRVAAGLIQVSDTVKALYAGVYSIRPAGDTDVIERAALIQAMKEAWPVVEKTPIAGMFLMDLLMKLFPETGAKYVKALEVAQAQAQSQQAQQQQMMMQKAHGIAQQLIQLAGRPEMFSTTGKNFALPAIQQVAQELSQFVSPQQVGPQGQ